MPFNRAWLMFPSKRFINSIIPIMIIKHHKKKKNAMSVSEELVSFSSLINYLSISWHLSHEITSKSMIFLLNTLLTLNVECV